MKKTREVVDENAALGMLGLFLMLLVARLAPPAYSASGGVFGSVSGFAARRAIDAIAAFGWLVDRLLPSPPGLDRPAHAV